MKLYACRGNFRFEHTNSWLLISDEAPKEVLKMRKKLAEDFTKKYFRNTELTEIGFYSTIPGKRGETTYVVMVPFGDDTFVVSPYVLPWVEWVAPCLNIFGYAVGTGKNGWAEF